jgi:hypothetical protein
LCRSTHDRVRRAGLSPERAGLYCLLRNSFGGMAEWLKAHAWKACIRETVSWVRIPLPPPRTKSMIYLTFLSLRGYELLRTFRGFAARAPTPLFAQRRIFRRSRAFAGASQLRLCGGTAVSCRVSIFLMSELNMRTRDRRGVQASPTRAAPRMLFGAQCREIIVEARGRVIASRSTSYY